MARITRGETPFQVSSRFSPVSGTIDPILEADIDTLKYRMPAMVTAWKDSLSTFKIHRTRTAGYIVKWDFTPEEIDEIRSNLTPFKDGREVLHLFHKAGMYTDGGAAVDFYVTTDTTLLSVQRIEWNAYPCLIRWRDGMAAGCVGWYELLNIANGNSASNLDTTWHDVEPAEDVFNLRIPLGESEFVIKGEPSVWQQRENGPYIQSIQTDNGTYVRYVTYLECAEYLEEMIAGCSSSEVPVVHKALPYDKKKRENREFEYFYSTQLMPVYTLDGYNISLSHDYTTKTSVIILGPENSWNQEMANNRPSGVYIFSSYQNLLAHQSEQSAADYDPLFDQSYIDQTNGEETLPAHPSCLEDNQEAQFNCFRNQLNRSMVEHFEYPEISRQMGAQGKAFVGFTINKLGVVVGITIERSSGDPLIDQAAMEACSHFPQLIPAISEGRPVNMRYTMPVKARLQ